MNRYSSKKRFFLTGIFSLITLALLFFAVIPVLSQSNAAAWIEDFSGEIHSAGGCEDEYYCGEISRQSMQNGGWRIIQWVQHFSGPNDLSTRYVPENVKIKDGKLELTTGGTFPTSGQIELKQPAGFGFYEANIKFSEVSSQTENERVEGVTNGFFLYSHESYERQEPFEIDIEYNSNNHNMVINGTEPGLYFTVHYFQKTPKGIFKESSTTVRYKENSTSWNSGGFNQVGFCWVPGYTAFIVNNQVAGVICDPTVDGVPCDGTAAVPSGEMLLILNHWSNNDRFNGLAPVEPVKMYVDSVSYEPASDIQQCQSLFEAKPSTSTPIVKTEPVSGPVWDSSGLPVTPTISDMEGNSTEQENARILPVFFSCAALFLAGIVGSSVGIYRITKNKIRS